MIKAGFAVRDISPEKPVPGRLGLNHMIKPHHPISAKAVAFLQDETYILIVCEIVGLTKSENLAIRRKITAQTRVKHENIVITCTHTHASPWVWDLQDEEARKQGFDPLDREWMNKVIEKTAEAGSTSLENTGLYEVRFGKAETDRIVSNRVEPVTRWSICADDELRNAPAGEIDPFVRTMSFHDESGKPVFIFTNLAVHPTAFGGGKTLLVSPDFPYVSEVELRDKFGKDLVTAYWQGCGGCSNSGKYVKEGSEDEVKDIGRRFARAINKAVNDASPLDGPFEYRYMNLRLPAGDFIESPEEARALFIDKCNKIKNGRDDDETIFHWRKKLKRLDVSLLSRDGGMDIELQLLRFGNTDFLFVPGEWYVQLYKNLEAEYPDRNLVVTTLNNFDLLYIPDEGSMQNTDWYGVRTGMRSLGNESAIRLYDETVGFLR